MQESDVHHILYPTSSESREFRDGAPLRGQRYTQDTPIMPEVWIAYATKPEEAKQRGILLSPNADSSVRDLVVQLRAALAASRKQDGNQVFLAYNESHVIAHVTFEELIRCVLPLSVWWRNQIDGADIHAWFQRLADNVDLPRLLMDPARQLSGISPDVLDMIRVAGAIALHEPLGKDAAYFRSLIQKLDAMFLDFAPPEVEGPPPLWSVFSCRPVQSAVSQSRVAVKADAAIRVFELSCKDLIWAVIDSGIDGGHDAFLEWPATDPRDAGTKCDGAPAKPKSRVLRTYDFTRVTRVLEAAFRDDAMQQLKAFAPADVNEESLQAIASDLKSRLNRGQIVDWGLLEPLLRMSPGADGKVPPPVNEHGTHVAGILAADWRKLPPGAPPPHQDYIAPRTSVIGVCPDLKLYDLRVIKDDGTGDEFSVLSALQFVRYLNMNRDKMVVHGVNLSFSLPQLVKSFACGSSPVCQESERLVNSGVTVVTAAGNRGYLVANDGFEWYRSLSITDPGNADAVITVGSTHRTEPHRYGVSYFSSRGPTGDGRMKPDIVAPGEKIQSVVPGKGNSAVALDGTSMAAPHVSGAAALLMARHRELIGRPRKVKEVLCASATDLGRERSFQGAGMLDVLRALQAV
ncbi:MAG: S8 family peptidase [Candidatus Solibacter sp.]